MSVLILHVCICVCLFRTTIQYFFSVSNTLSQRVRRRQHRPTLLVSISRMTSLFAVCLSFSASVYLCLPLSISLLLSACISLPVSVSTSVCLCLSARTSQKSQVQTSRNFLYVLSVAVARFCSDNVAIRYVPYVRFCG